MADISTLAIDAFQPLVNTEIVLTDDLGRSLAVTVASVTAGPRSTAPDARRAAFSVQFTVPLPCDADSGDYTVLHPTLGLIGPLRITRIVPGTLTQNLAAFQLILN